MKGIRLALSLHFLKSIILKRIITIVYLIVFFSIFLSYDIFGRTFVNIKALESYIDLLKSYEKIIIEGHYKGTLTIRKPVHLESKNAVFDGEGKHDIIKVESTASGTIIDGFRIINSGKSLYFYHTGIKVDKAKKMVIKNNVFENNLNAIYLIKSHETIVLNNYSTGLARTLSVEKAGDGIHLFACKSTLIKNNRMFEHRDGTYMEYSHKNRIINNHYARHLRYGLHFMYSKDNYFENNLFEDCGTGASIMYTDRMTMKRNIFRNIRGSRAYGILFKDANKVLLEENIFHENTIGIYMDNSHDNIIHNNLFSANGWTIDIFSSCHGNIFYENAFVAGTYEVSSDTRKTKNFFFHPELKKGNYWGAYKGYDLNGDNKGDIPHNPVSFFGVLAKRYPDITIFAKSPVAAAIDYAERALPIVSTKGFEDKYPLMKWEGFNFNLQNSNSFSLFFFIFSLILVFFSIFAIMKIIKH